MLNLYKLSKALKEKTMHMGDVLLNGEEPSQELIDECVDLSGDFRKKITSYGYVVKTLQAERTALDDEIKRLQKEKKAKDRHIDILQGRMHQALVANEIDKVDDDPVMTIAIQKNPPSVEIDDGFDLDSLPAEFVRTKKEVDKTAIKQAILGGQKFNGVRIINKQTLKIG